MWLGLGAAQGLMVQDGQEVPCTPQDRATLMCPKCHCDGTHGTLQALGGNVGVKLFPSSERAAGGWVGMGL